MLRITEYCVFVNIFCQQPATVCLLGAATNASSLPPHLPRIEGTPHRMPWPARAGGVAVLPAAIDGFYGPFEGEDGARVA